MKETTKKAITMHNHLISVIIPNYCHAKYLDQRIQSVLDQTYHNFEVIILDDCSPDDGASRAVIEKYRANPHVSHIEYNEANSGSTFKQWHKGFSLAKGDIIWIAESDDYCDKDLLEELVPMWEKYPEATVVEAASRHVNADGSYMTFNSQYSGKTIHETGIECIQNHLICSNFYLPNASAITFRKDVLNSIPKDYETYQASGDRLFWIYFAEKGDVVKVDKPLSYFRQHNNKVSPRKELDGTQCKENYRINCYLHSKGYVTGKYRLTEFNFYYGYIKDYPFASEDVRKELMSLWFNRWYYNKFTYRMINFSLRVYNKLKLILK